MIIASRAGERTGTSRGFTFLELTIVLLVAGIVTALAVPLTGRVVVRMSIRKAASGIKSACVLARTQAMANPQTHVGVHIDTTEKSYVMFFDRDGDNEYVVANDSTYLAVNHLQGSISVTVDSDLRKGIIFRGDGSAYRGGSVHIANKDGSIGKTITISKVSGYVRVTE